MNEDLSLLESRLGITFSNPQLLEQAFTHASYVNEHRLPPGSDNERLEFLGDAVLELTVSDYLFHRHPQLPEGELTKMRASIVCEASLVYFAQKLQFGEFIRLGKGEEMTGGRMRPAMLADVFESFVGALYLDGGIESVFSFLETHLFPHIEQIRGSILMDYKSLLQETVQQKGNDTIRYEIIDERGPAHDRKFVATVFINDRPLGTGNGSSKKEAEQQAAAEALSNLKTNGV